MFLNAAKGDNALFVGSEELVEAWRIFTPLLHTIDAQVPAAGAGVFIFVVVSSGEAESQ